MQNRRETLPAKQIIGDRVSNEWRLASVFFYGPGEVEHLAGVSRLITKVPSVCYHMSFVYKHYYLSIAISGPSCLVTMSDTDEPLSIIVS